MSALIVAVLVWFFWWTIALGIGELVMRWRERRAERRRPQGIVLDFRHRRGGVR